MSRLYRPSKGIQCLLQTASYLRGRKPTRVKKPGFFAIIDQFFVISLQRNPVSRMGEKTYQENKLSSASLIICSSMVGHSSK